MNLFLSTIATTPVLITTIANTIKGKGFSFSENTNEWHHKILTKSQYEAALEELEKNEN